MLSRNCLFCNKQFFKGVNTSKRSWEEKCKFCSKLCGNTYRRGKTNGRKGISPSEETRKKIGASLIGHKHTPETRLKMLGRRKGPLNNKWKGGITPENKLIRQSPQYKQWRTAVFERDNYTCQMCGARNNKGVGHSIKLEADHIKPFSVYTNLRFDVSNGRTLCTTCHRTTPTWGVNYIRYNITP